MVFSAVGVVAGAADGGVFSGVELPAVGVVAGAADGAVFSGVALPAAGVVAGAAAGGVFSGVGLPSRVKKGKKGVTSNGILSAAAVIATGFVLISSS